MAYTRSFFGQIDISNIKKENINMALLYPETAGHVISIIIKGKLWTKVSGHSRVNTLKQTESSKN